MPLAIAIGAHWSRRTRVITTKQLTNKSQRNQIAINTNQKRRSENLQLIADGAPPTDAATQLTLKWGDGTISEHKLQEKLQMLRPGRQ